MVWVLKKTDKNGAFRAIRNSSQGLLLHTLTSLFHTLASFKTAIRLCNIIYRLKKTEKHNMTSLNMQKTPVFRIFIQIIFMMLLLSSLMWNDDWQGTGRQRVWHMARWAAFHVLNNVLLSSPRHWSAIISMHFRVGMWEKDRQVHNQFFSKTIQMAQFPLFGLKANRMLNKNTALVLSVKKINS